MKFRSTWLFALGIALSASLSAAGMPNQEIEGRARENIHRLRLIRMTEALELTEEQTAAIYPMASRIEKEKTAILRALSQEIRDLKQRLNAEKPDEAAISEIVVKMKEMRANLLAKDKEFEDFLESHLTTLQKAKYLIFSAEFNRGLGEQISRVRALAREKRRQ